MEDVHRAGGVMAILGELERGGLVHRNVPTVLMKSLGEKIDVYDIRRTNDKDVKDYFPAATGGVQMQTPFPQDPRSATPACNSVNVCYAALPHATTTAGGLVNSTA